MATVSFGAEPFSRFYAMSVSTSPVGIASTHLKTFGGKNIVRAVGVVLGGSVRMGALGMLTPSASVGLPLAVNDVIVLEGMDNITKALFIQNSGAATIDWMLQGATV